LPSKQSFGAILKVRGKFGISASAFAASARRPALRRIVSMFALSSSLIDIAILFTSFRSLSHFSSARNFSSFAQCFAEELRHVGHGGQARS